MYILWWFTVFHESVQHCSSWNKKALLYKEISVLITAHVHFHCNQRMKSDIGYVLHLLYKLELEMLWWYFLPIRYFNYLWWNELFFLILFCQSPCSTILYQYWFHYCIVQFKFMSFTNTISFNPYILQIIQVIDNSLHLIISSASNKVPTFLIFLHPQCFYFLSPMLYAWFLSWFTFRFWVINCIQNYLLSPFIVW